MKKYKRYTIFHIGDKTVNIDKEQISIVNKEFLQINNKIKQFQKHRQGIWKGNSQRRSVFSNIDEYSQYYKYIYVYISYF